ncbi:MAG: 30S ribosomal protein S6 [Candidatus Midichloria mitochondrii]|nr:30S ribosomal protein S6 [Candidatus Midichloria mitochondrii]MDJ1583586.1 30S ribosomal protein S6 [Candidatus Midichloria mitochondrii]
MSFYECVFIMRQDMPAQDVHRAVGVFVQLIEKFRSELIKKEYWGLRTLAHVIKKNKKGHYVMLGLKAETAAINELERHFKISEDVLRYICLKCDSIDQNSSPMMSAPSELKAAVQ